MPLVTKASSRHQRRAPGWTLIAVLLLPLLVLFAWSWFQPVRLVHQRGGVQFGYLPRAQRGGWFAHSNMGWVGFKLPGGRNTGTYGIGWGWM